MPLVNKADERKQADVTNARGRCNGLKHLVMTCAGHMRNWRRIRAFGHTDRRSVSPQLQRDVFVLPNAPTAARYLQTRRCHTFSRMMGVLTNAIHRLFHPDRSMVNFEFAAHAT